MLFKRCQDRRNPGTTQTAAFHVEPLESRQMLAGDVDVVVRGLDVFIYGDSSDNSIVLSDNDGILDVGQAEGDSTNINGGNTGLAIGDVRNLVIYLRAGNDHLDVDAVAPTDDLRIYGGTGDDSIRSGGTGNSAMLSGGAGNDELLLSGEFGHSVTLRGRGGNDELSVRGAVGGSLKLNGGNGNDGLMIEGSTMEESEIRAGAGRDSVSIFEVNATGQMKVMTGAGDDQMDLFSVQPSAANHFEGGAEILMGAGNDSFRYTGGFFGRDPVTIGEGNIFSLDGGRGLDTNDDPFSILTGDQFEISGFDLIPLS